MEKASRVVGSRDPFPQLHTHAAEIEHLKLMIAKLPRMQLGRKSEKLEHQIEQLELQLEDLQADEAESARKMPEVDQAPRRKSMYRPLPEHLPRDEKIYVPGLKPVRPAVADCVTWAKTWPSNWNMCRPAPRDPPCAPKAGMQLLRCHRTGTSAKPAHRARHRRIGLTGSRLGGQVRLVAPCASPHRRSSHQPR